VDTAFAGMRGSDPDGGWLRLRQSPGRRQAVVARGPSAPAVRFLGTGRGLIGAWF